MLDKTMVFSISADKDDQLRQSMKQVYNALVEKGYNPINQIVGYLLSRGSDLYNHPQQRAQDNRKTGQRRFTGSTCQIILGYKLRRNRSAGKGLFQL